MENTIRKSIKAANGEMKNINELMNIPLRVYLQKFNRTFR